jgi:hypothetical protein
MVDTYLSAQLFAAPAAGKKRQKLADMNKTGRFKKKTLKTAVNFEEHQQQNQRKPG